MEDASIKGKIVIQGELHLKSPMIIGSGQDEFADIEVIKDSKGNPFIPATSLTGVIRNYFDENYPERLKEKYQFFGYSRKNDNEKHESFQSAFICHDLHAQKALIRIRDGVKIDPSSQTAEDMGKYDFEIIENGAVFDLFWEVTIRDIHDPDTFKQILECKLKKLCISHFDFSKKDDVFRWLKQDFSKGTPKLDCKPFEPENHNKIFCIEARFAIKSSLIVRSYSEEANMPDATSITSNGKYVLPGTSVKGAIRHTTP